MKVRMLIYTLLTLSLLLPYRNKNFSAAAQTVSASFASHTTIVPAKESTAKSSFYVSDWEAAATWNAADNNGFQVMSFDRNTPELSNPSFNNGTVVVFAKGYSFDTKTTMDQKPLSLPFYFMSPDDQYVQPYHWFSSNNNNAITVSLQMPKEMEGGFQQGNSKMQFRYFVITSQFLQEHQLELTALRHMSYQQLTQLLAVNP